MSTSKTAPPPRPAAIILRELDAARATLRELRTACEADDSRRRQREAAIEKSQLRWARDHAGEPWDPNAYTPPMIPLQMDAELHKRHHRQHYVIQALEAELESLGGLDPLGD